MSAGRTPAHTPGTPLPRLCRWLLTLAAPAGDRDFLLDDLAEEFVERRYASGWARATTWVVWQTLRSLGPLAASRLRHRRRSRSDVSSGDPVLTRLLDDLRYSLRIAVRRPWLSLTIVATMILGVGTTTAVFSVIDALLLRPLSFPAPEQLVHLSSPVPDAPTAMVASLPDLTDWQADTKSIASLGFYDVVGVTAQTGTEPERVGAVVAGPGFGETLRIHPALGRFFLPDEYLETGPAAAILTHAFWLSRFAGDRSVVGRSILVNGKPRTIVGVLPAIESAFPQGDLDVWLPLVVTEASNLTNRFSLRLSAIARLRPDISLERVNGELATFARRLATMYPATNTGRTLYATPLRDSIVGPVRSMLLLLGGAVGAVLLIACANLGSLLLAHSQSRVREFAVRAAIGGAANRIARQLLVESLLLATIGGAAGIWLARALVKGLVAVYPTRLPRATEIALDWRMLVIALGVTILTGLLAGLPLARQVRRLDLVRDLRDGERGLGSRGRRRLLDGLVVAQLATSVALVSAAGVLLRTFMDMTAVRPGFDAQRVLTFYLSISPVRYSTPERETAFYDALFDSLRTTPGVQDAGWGMFTPLGGGGWGDTFARVGSADAAPNLPAMQLKMVSPEYAATLRIPLIAGRHFARTDRTGTPDVAIVNVALAAKYYPGHSPLGKRITFQQRTLEIVGIIGDVRSRSLWVPPAPELYVPIEQWGWRDGTIFVRTTTEPREVEARVRGIVRTLDPSIPALNITALDERVRRSMAPERFRAILVGTLAILAFLLSLLGIYGLVAWVAGRRTREIGIRMALGEAASRVQLRVLSHAMRLGALGATLGAGLAFASARYLQTFVAGDVRPRDPLVMLGTMALFLVVTAAAAWIPARRASKVDPLLAIRAD
jgi:putative ABC transport system permease protein